MERYNRTAWLSAALAAAIMCVNGYDSSTFNSIQGYATFVNKFKEPGAKVIDPNIIGAVNTAYNVGGIVTGFLITPSVSKRLGRRFCIVFGLSLVIISTFVQAFAPNMGAFIAGRLIMGLGQGFAIPTGPTYIAEIAPAKVRGTMMSFYQLGYVFGAFVVYWTAYGTKKSPHLGDWQWRTPIIIQVAFPLVISIGMFFCPESPRWLVERGRTEDALVAMRRVRSPPDAETELETVIAAVHYEKSQVKDPKWYTPYITLFKEKSLRRRMFVALFINAGQQLCGNGQLSTYSTLIYSKAFSDANTVFLLNAIYGSLAILFTLSCTLLVDRFGRRNLLLLGACGQGLALLIVAIIGSTTHVNADGSRPLNVGIAIAAMFHVFAVFYKPTWGATVWVYTSDIFSTNVRAHAVAMASQTQAVVNSIVNQFFPIFLNKAGFHAFFFFAGLNIFLFLGVWFFVPESKKVSLEDIDKLFGATGHREAGEALAVAEQKQDDKDLLEKERELEHDELKTIPIVKH